MSGGESSRMAALVLAGAVFAVLQINNNIMRDQTIYTEEGLKAIIRHIRMYGAMLKDEEARLIMLYQATLHHKSPVDAKGQKFGVRKEQFKFPDLPDYLRVALRSGDVAQLPGYQD